MYIKYLTSNIVAKTIINTLKTGKSFLEKGERKNMETKILPVMRYRKA
jgi:hypothetical protein